MPAANAARDIQVVDPVLTQIARQYRPDGFVADRLAPRIEAPAITGKYPTFSGFFGDDGDADVTTSVADRAVTPEISFEWSTDSYDCEPYRLRVSITDRERANAHAALRIERSKLTRLMDAHATRREVRVAALLRQTGDGGELTGGSATPANNWDVDAATVEADIKTGALAIRDKIGRLTNAIVFDLAVGYAIAVQQDIREIIKYTVPGDRIVAQGREILPSLIHGHKVVIAEAMRNTAKKGATESLGKVWSDEVRLLYTPANPGWGEPGVAYSFTFQGEKVDRYRDNEPPVEYIRVWEDLDEKVTAPDAGYSIKAVLS